jgi:hypothetical protein
MKMVKKYVYFAESLVKLANGKITSAEFKEVEKHLGEMKFVDYEVVKRKDVDSVTYFKLSYEHNGSTYFITVYPDMFYGMVIDVDCDKPDENNDMNENNVNYEAHTMLHDSIVVLDT